MGNQTGKGISDTVDRESIILSNIVYSYFHIYRNLSIQYPAYGRHWISQHVQIIASNPPKNIDVSCVIFIFHFCLFFCFAHRVGYWAQSTHRWWDLSHELKWNHSALYWYVLYNTRKQEDLAIRLLQPLLEPFPHTMNLLKTFLFC